jgi:RNA polymerase sigma-70 factor (ECF subfamily)
VSPLPVPNERVSEPPLQVDQRPAVPVGTDGESVRWLAGLRAAGNEHADSVARLHALLLRAARFELHRRRSSHPRLGTGELDQIALEVASDALMAILARLDEFRGASRFTTWAYKFAVYEAGVKLRRRAWQGREIPVEPEVWACLPDPASPLELQAEQAVLLAAVRDAIEQALTPHQRRVLVALALNGVPIDVLAERLGTTRGALYKTLHDARHKLRAHLTHKGLMARSSPRDQER